VTADQLKATSRKPPQVQQQPTVDDRLQLVRNVARVKRDYLGVFIDKFDIKSNAS
jgi:hypothetical protein